MNIYGIQPTRVAVPAETVGAVVPGNSLTQPPGTCDVVEISTVARLAARIREIPDVRADLVAQAKAEIAAGTYETNERIEITIDRLMEELLPG